MIAMLKLFALINLPHLKAQRLRSVLSVLGVACGVALILAVLTLRESILGSFVRSLEAVAGKAVIEISAPSSSGFDQGLLVDVVQIEGIQDAIPMVRGFTVLASGLQQREVLVLGVPPDVHKILPDYAVQQIELLNTRVRRVVLLPQELADALQVQIEDQVELLAPDGMRAYSLIGLLPATELERLHQGNLAVMDLPVAQEVLGRPGKYDSIYITLQEGFHTETTLETVRARLGSQLIVDRPSFRGKSIEDMLQGLQDMLLVVSSVTLFVGMFLIYNTMSMSVMERRLEMGLLRALGLSPKEVFGLSMLEGAFIGLAGGIAGILLGALMARPLVAMTAGYIASSYPLHASQTYVTPENWPPCLLAGLAASLMATYWPARQILRLSPVGALRPRGVLEPIQSRRTWSSAVGVALMAIGVVGGALYLSVLAKIYVLGLALFSVCLGVAVLVPHMVLALSRLFLALSPLHKRLAGSIAGNNLLTSVGRTSVTVGALMVSVATMVAVGGTTTSFSSSVHGTFEAMLGADVYVESTTWRNSGSDVPLVASFAGELEQIEGVSLVAPVRFMLCDWQGRQVIVVASNPELQQHVQHIPVESGDEKEIWQALSRGGSATVSSFLAQRVGLQVGDEIELPSPTGAHRFEVAGIVTSYSLGQGIVHINRTDLDRYWHDRSVDQFAIRVNGRTSAEVKDEILALHARDKQLVVMTKEERLAETSKLTGNVLSLFDGLKVVVILVAAIGIANPLFAAVLERAKEIGILRALGMSRNQVAEMILLEGMATGVIGGILGIGLGLALFALMVQSVGPATGFRIDYAFPYQPIASSLVIAMAVSIVASLLPARRAAATNVAQALTGIE